MSIFSTPVWITLGILAFLGVVGVLHALACHIRNELELITLRGECLALRREYIARLRALGGRVPDDEPIMEIAPVDDTPTQRIAA